MINLKLSLWALAAFSLASTAHAVVDTTFTGTLTNEMRVRYYKTTNPNRP
jgi:hypothetical protein